MKSIVVFCGSNIGKNPAYAEEAQRLGKLLVEKGIRLIYGGGKVGLMGKIADAVLAEGGEVIGVIPQFLVEMEVAHTTLTEQIIVRSMHERKNKMSELADGFITMPGGIGSFEEFFEILTWGQLALHQKPIGILNVKGYYNGLLEFLNFSAQEGFVRPTSLDMILVNSEADKLLSQMQEKASLGNIDLSKT